MNISPWQVYWIMQLDSLSNALVIVTCMLLFLAVLVSIIGAAGADYLSRENRRFLLKAFKRLLIVATCAIVANAFVPSTRTMAAVVILPRIVNNPSVQHEAGDLYKLAKDALFSAAHPQEPTK